MHIIKLEGTKPSTSDTPQDFSTLTDGKLDFIDIYVDARSFLAKANTTKFVITAFLLVLSPILLIQGYLQEDTFREIVLVVALAYLGVDAFESTRNRKEIMNEQAAP